MTRRVVVLVLFLLAVGVVSAELAVASTAGRPGTKIDIEGADDAFATGDYYLRTYVGYIVSAILGIAGATQIGSRPVMGYSGIAGGVIAAIWTKVADSASTSVEAAVPGMTLAVQMSFWGMWLQRGSYLFSEALLFFFPLLAWRLQRQRAA